VLGKLVAAYVAPTAALFAVFAYVVHDVASDDLEAELGARLAAVAGAASTHIRDASLARLQPGDESDSRYGRCRAVLEAVAQDTGAARLYVFDRERRSICDSRPEVPIGSSYYHLEQDSTELERVFAGTPAASVLFEGEDGLLYKAGYAPARLAVDEGPAEMAVGVEAPAEYFDRLASLRTTLWAYGAGVALVVFAVSFVVALRITTPVRDLAAAAERIGRGDLAQPVDVVSRDEIGFLAQTMEGMRSDLQARDERMQLMLSGIAHEVRNPLGGIALFTGILRDELPAEADDARGHVRRIEKEMAYLEAVVNDFLEYARRSAPETERVELDELVAAVAELVAPAAAERGVTVAATGGGVAAVADRGHLRRALLNLLRNAVDASAGRVAVRAMRGGDDVVIEVENDGDTIPAEQQKRLFEPFFTTKEKGTGLGLALVREIAADHGGKIEVDSGDGRTVFRLRLPWRPS